MIEHPLRVGSLGDAARCHTQEVDDVPSRLPYGGCGRYDGIRSFPRGQDYLNRQLRQVGLIPMGERRSESLWAASVALVSSVMVLSAMTAGQLYPAHGFPYRKPAREKISAGSYPWIRFDAHHYRDIAIWGYDPPTADKPSNAAFFPGYPWAAWLVSSLSGLPIPWAMLLVALGLFAGAMALWPRYLRCLPWMSTRDRWCFVLLYASWPASLFFRAGYSESMFLFCCVAFLCSLRDERDHAPWYAAVWAALAATTRVVGVVMPIILWVHLRSGKRKNWSALKILCCLAVSASGVVAVSYYQYYCTGDPLAFVHARAAWAIRAPAPWWERLLSLLGLEPLWNPQWLLEGGPKQRGYAAICGFCHFVWLNPITALAFPFVLLIADWKQLLRGEEILLGFSFWAIPYFGHGHENALLSHARYGLFVFPAYLVLVHLLHKAPPWAVYGLVSVLFMAQLFFAYGFGAYCAVF